VEQTCLYVFVSVPITMLLALLLALILNQPLRALGVCRVLYYTPVVIPTVVAAAFALSLAVHPEHGSLVAE